MEEYDKIINICINHLIANEFNQAKKKYTENYFKYPDKIELLYGVIISDILSNNINGTIDFLDKEKKVSIFYEKLNLILDFFRQNNFFKNMKVNSILFNIGLFLYKKRMFDDAVVFLKSCLIVNPGSKKVLLLLGEYELSKNRDISRGVDYILNASKATP